MKGTVKYDIQFKPRAVKKEELANYEDLLCLRKAKKTEKNSSTISLDDLKKKIKENKKHPKK